MIVIDLIRNVALLVALAAIYQVIAARAPDSVILKSLIFGVLFGAVGIVGMLTPIYYSEGVIFDGRSIVLFTAGLFGGPIAAFISSAMVGAYRLWLGGAGALFGALVAVSSAAIGVVFYYIRRKRGIDYDVLQLLGISLLVHLIMFLILWFLPNRMGQQAFRDIGLPILVLYPIATMLVSLLFQDYEERIAVKRKLHRLAYFDSLTGLPNRQYLIESLMRLLQGPQRAEHDKLLLLINLDRFKTLNDARGHAVGDQLLCALASKLGKYIDRGDILARMSADEFAILVQTPDNSFSSINVRGQRFADELQAFLKFPISLGEDEVSVSSSIGIASFPMGTGDSAGHILRRADMAMHLAKQKGGNQSVVFQLAMASSVEQKYQVERELRKAIPAGELVLYFQSQVNARGEIVGAEALVRWRHPERGLVPPMDFIPVAEESDLIVDMGNWTLADACRILAMENLFAPDFRLSVNISPRHFAQLNFTSNLRHILETAGADPRHLTLEVTESLLIQNISDVVDKMTELAALGIHFSLDDFGTGYSSLSYLKRLPIHEIKIDKSFVQDAPIDPDDAALVESILAVAKHMDLAVVAEGVETSEQADFLNNRGLGKVIHQGYYFHKPEPSDSWLTNYKPSTR